MGGAVLGAGSLFTGDGGQKVSDPTTSAEASAPEPRFTMAPARDPKKPVTLPKPAEYPPTETPEPGFLSDPERRYLREVSALGVPVLESRRALLDGKLVCDSIKGRSLASVTEAVRRENPELSEDDATLTSVSALYAMCPSRSPFGEPITESGDSTGADGELAIRVQTLGVNIADYRNPANLARRACAEVISGRSISAAVSVVSGAARGGDTTRKPNPGEKPKPETQPALPTAETTVFVVEAIRVFCPARMP